MVSQTITRNLEHLRENLTRAMIDHDWFGRKVIGYSDWLVSLCVIVRHYA